MIMPGRRISDLSEYNFNGQNIDNCFFVDSVPNPLRRISLGDIFEWIRETAIKEGLTIELQDDKIIFIKN